MAPIPDLHGARRGVVAEGPVGTRWAGRLRMFRYEIRRWRGGEIPDAQEAVSTVRVGIDLTCARRLLDLAPSVPTPVWGRDELDTGEMWNSNSVTSWLLKRAGVNTDQIEPPLDGRAPGWRAGLVIAARDLDNAEHPNGHRTGAPGSVPSGDVTVYLTAKRISSGTVTYCSLRCSPTSPQPAKSLSSWCPPRGSNPEPMD